jgi:hypothetical protein
VASVSDHWFTTIDGFIDDGDLPKSARRWKPPAWVKKLDRVAAKKHRELYG